jgi:hypothetical protein
VSLPHISWKDLRGDQVDYSSAELQFKTAKSSALPKDCHFDRREKPFYVIEMEQDFSPAQTLAQTGFFFLGTVQLLSRQGGQGGRFARNDKLKRFL